jgi:hypothetical protein
MHSFELVHYPLGAALVCVFHQMPLLHQLLHHLAHSNEELHDLETPWIGSSIHAGILELLKLLELQDAPRNHPQPYCMQYFLLAYDVSSLFGDIS